MHDDLTDLIYELGVLFTDEIFREKAGDHLYNNSSYFIDVGGIGHLSPGSRHHDPLPFLVSFPKL